MTSRRSITLMLLGLLLLSPMIGSAAESADSKMVFVGVQQKDHPQTALGRSIERRLERMVEPYRLPRPTLTADERACRALECLLDLAQTQRAERILGGDVTSQLEQLTVVTVWLFDARSRQSAEEEARCERCDAAALEEAVANAAARLLETHPAGSLINTAITPIGRPIQPPGQIEPPKSCPEVNCQGKDLMAQKRQTRHILASVFGTMLAATLITSISLTAIDKTSDSLCRLNSDFSQRGCANLPALYGTGYALSLALAGGLAISLALPIK